MSARIDEAQEPPVAFFILTFHSRQIIFVEPTSESVIILYLSHQANKLLALKRESQSMEEQMLDLISCLPHDILRRINSFVPLKQAVRTSTLSTVWRGLWVPVRVNLEFSADSVLGSRHEASQRVEQALGTFLKSYDYPEILKLCLGCRKGKKDSSETKDELTILATKGVEYELHLEFHGTQKLTSSFHLILEPAVSTTFGNPPMEAAGLSSLRTLHLRSVTSLTKELVSDLVSCCRFIENLKLEKCIGLQRLNIAVDSHLQSFSVLDCPDIVNLAVSAQGLKSFEYRGVLPQILMKQTSSLVDVMLNLKGGTGHNEFDCHEVLSLLASLKDVECLTVSGWLLEWLCSAGVIFSRLEFQFSNLKKLHWVDSQINKPKRDSLACFLNASPSLEKLVIDIECSHSPVGCPYFYEHWHEPHLWMDCDTVRSNVSRLEHLKTCHFKGFTNEDDQLVLVDLLLEKAMMLKSITVTSTANESWEVTNVPKSQPELMTEFGKNHKAVTSPNNGFLPGLTEANNNGFIQQMAGVCKSYLSKYFNL